MHFIFIINFIYNRKNEIICLAKLDSISENEETGKSSCLKIL